MAVELHNGTVRLHANSGCGTMLISIGEDLDDGVFHHVDVFINQHDVILRLDYCLDATIDETEFRSHVTREGVCQSSGRIPGCSNFITTPEVLQLGGAANHFLSYQSVSYDYFDGVISDVTNNGFLYDLADPVHQLRTVAGNVKTDAFCFTNNEAVCFGNSRCVATFAQFIRCDCEVGRYGDRCQFM